jgi:hypothetical protein
LICKFVEHYINRSVQAEYVLIGNPCCTCRFNTFHPVGGSVMKSFHALLLAGVALISCARIYAGAAHVPSDPPTLPGSSTTIQRMHQMPLGFTQNMGQWDESILFRAYTGGGTTMWFTKEGVTYQLMRCIASDGGGRTLAASSDSGQNMVKAKNRFSNGKDLSEQLVLTARYIGANPNPEVVGEGLMEYKCNYFIGSDPAKWHTDVPNYSAIILRDIYPGIDLRYSNGGGDQAVYDFITAPGANIAQVKVAYDGANGISLGSDGKMIVRTKWGDMIGAIESPGNGALSDKACFSQLTEKTVGFGGGGSSRQALGTLSVVLSYSALLGGGSADQAFGIAVDGSGCAYVTGFTASSDFPTMNPYRTDKGSDDVFITKLSSTGNSLIYSTYLGGGDWDRGSGIAVDGSGNAFVTGWTKSYDFPTLNPFQGPLGEGDINAFVTKLSSVGNSLIYSTYLGGGSDDWGNSIAIDGSGSAYVTGHTYSFNFPTLNPFQATNHGSPEVFVTRLSVAGNSLIYSTYLGGGGDDWGNGIAVDGVGNAYITGHTHSFNYPTVNPYQTYQGGGQYGWDAFVTKLSKTGNSLVYSTFLGGSEDDHGYGIAVNSSGNAFVTGCTESSDFPTSSPFRGSFTDGDIDAFVTKLSSTGNSLIYSTFLGGANGDYGYGIAVDGSDNAFVTGITGSTNFPILNPYQTGGGIFATRFSGTGSDLIYSTYLGNNGDYGYDIAVDGSGIAYVTGWTFANNSTTWNSAQVTYQHGWDAFVAKLGVSPDYLCGDVNGDAGVDISDESFLIAYIFSGGRAPNPLSAGDVNCDSMVDISDVAYMIAYIFSGGPAPCATCN